jgi:hypothetical protein
MQFLSAKTLNFFYITTIFPRTVKSESMKIISISWNNTKYTNLSSGFTRNFDVPNYDWSNGTPVPSPY